MLMLFAEGGAEAGWAGLGIATVLMVERVVTLALQRRFDTKFALLEKDQQHCKEDAIKKDAEIIQLRKDISIVHERGNIASVDRNNMHDELENVKATVNDVTGRFPAKIEEVKAAVETIPIKVVEKIKEVLP